MLGGVIIFGASGAGSTTLGRSVAGRLGYQYLDVDDYLWYWDDPVPFVRSRPPQARTEGLLRAIKVYPKFVLAGTIFDDRELFHPLLALAVFLSAPAEVCAERVRTRELARWGARVQPGGDMYKATRFHGDAADYLANARRYETADVSKFGRALHEAWAAALPCPVLRLDGTDGVCENTDKVVAKFHE